VVSVEHLVIIAVTCAARAAVPALPLHAVGIAMQATSQNQLAAFYMGIPVRRMNMLIWGLSSAICGLAGLLLAPITFVHANMGFVGLKAFPAAVVGGFGSIPGALVGGLIIGIVESLAGFYLPEGFKDIAAYVVVLVMLVVKPNGLFGENLRRRKSDEIAPAHILHIQDPLRAGHPPVQAWRPEHFWYAGRWPSRFCRRALAAVGILRCRSSPSSASTPSSASA
jgi:hypothetical protein